MLGTVYAYVAAVAGALLLAETATAQADQAFVGDNLGTGNSRAGAERERGQFIGVNNGQVPRDGSIITQTLTRVDLYTRTCPCRVPTGTAIIDDIRGISDAFVSGGNADNSFGLSNMVWGFGQFLDHDLALSIEDEQSPTFDVATATGVMPLHVAVTQVEGLCANTVNAQTAALDASQVYGVSKQFRDNVLQEPNSCKLRTEGGTFPPITTTADSDGTFFFVTGDVRISEQAFLAVQHTIWIREHNRLCDAIAANPSTAGLSPDAAFEMARAVVVAKWQRVVLEEFLPVLGITQADLEGATAKVPTSAISVEFSIGYRIGHDLIGDTVGSVGIVEAFNAEKFFTDSGGTVDAPTITLKPDAESRLSAIVSGLVSTPCKEFDGRMSDALRNFLFGITEGQDLAGRNIFRGREIGVPTYAGLAECFGITPDGMVQAETPDAWLGLLREPKAPGSPLGPTLRAMMIDQFHRTVFGGFVGSFYWEDDLAALGPFLGEVLASSYAQIITANTQVTASGDVFRV